MQYEGESVWSRPFGEKEAAGFGSGHGTVIGDRMSGTLTWANHPRMREDGVWCPNLNGFITTDDGAKVLVAVKGYSIRERPPGDTRAIVASVLFQARARDVRYRWLNYIVGVGEGEIDESSDVWWLKVYACFNEVASNPVALPEGDRVTQRTISRGILASKKGGSDPRVHRPHGHDRGPRRGRND